MTTTPATEVRHARIEGPGCLLVGAAERGLAGTFRLLVHQGVGIEWSAGDRRKLTFTRPASACWMGWYSTRILANGWEPYDQPHPAAYASVGFRKLRTLDLAEHGRLFRQMYSEPVHKLLVAEATRLVTCSRDSIREEIATVLRVLGLPEPRAAAALEFLLPSTESLDHLHDVLGLVQSLK